MNMTGPAYRSGGKRIPVARPPRRSDPETSTGSASAPDALPGTNRKTMTDSEKASVSSVSAGAPAPARQEKASSTLYPKALKSLEKRIRGYLLKGGQDDLRIRRRRQQTNQKRNDHPQAGRPRPGGDHIRAVEPRSATMARKIRCRHGQSSGQRHCGRRPSRPVGTVRTGAP